MIGVDIALQIAHQFGKNTAETAWAQMKAPSQLNTVMRAKEVTEHQITSVRTKTVDQMIVVDTSMFGFADFTSAREMSLAGEEAAAMAMDQFKQMLKRQASSQLKRDQRFTCDKQTQ